MITVYLENNRVRAQLYPFTQIRPASEIRSGILTIREKWELLLKGRNDLKFDPADLPANYQGNHSVTLPTNLLPSRQFLDTFFSGGSPTGDLSLLKEARILNNPWQIVEFNDWAIREDFKLITSGRISASIPGSVKLLGEGQVFLEEGAKLQDCTLNTTHGPIYIGRNSEIMEGSNIRGPFALCEEAVVKMGTRIYGATTIGPGCVVGGEIKNSVFFGYSNKGHDGYIGDSVIGEWCNLGAGTSNSNVKNTGGEIKVWSGEQKDFIPAGRKAGLFMGDYTRCAINTSFNTGTLTGIAANIFCHGLTPRYIPDFAWGPSKTEKANWEKTIAAIAEWKKLKNKILQPEEIQQLKFIFDQQ